MTNEVPVTRFFEGSLRRGQWSLHTRDGIIPVQSLVGRIVNIGTKDGMVYDSALAADFDDRDGVLVLHGGLHQSYADPQPLPTVAAEVRVRNIGRGYIHMSAQDSVA